MTLPPVIDLRSDTVTRPTRAMRAAMASAEVGDDILGVDPTVEALQSRFAALCGKPAALFVPTGTMGNQIALHLLSRPGDEVLCDADSHIVHYETGAPAVLSGLSIRPLAGVGGVFAPADIDAAIRPDNVHFPASTVLVIENTHNRGGGTVWPIDKLTAACAAGRAKGLGLHLDGARVWNAIAATGIPMTQWAAPFDTLTACFSKGLGAPAGSIVAGSADFVRRARRVRKMLGGSMRQVGILAAAALHALDHHIARLPDDHARARRLAFDLAATGRFEVEGVPPTNMIYFRLSDPADLARAAAFQERARAAGVLLNHTGGGRFRAVTHLDIDDDDVTRATTVLGKAAGPTA